MRYCVHELCTIINMRDLAIGPEAMFRFGTHYPTNSAYVSQSSLLALRCTGMVADAVPDANSDSLG